MNCRIFFSSLTILLSCIFILPSQAASKRERILSGFNNTAFGAEYSSFGFQSNYIRKFAGTVKFYIHNKSRKNRKSAARRFILSLNRSIRGLKTQIVKNPKQANFHLYIIDRKDYKKTVRKKIYRRPFAAIRGLCLVRSSYTRRGISESAAVIVSDEGERLFKRCLIEEVLQGLGPLNEDRKLKRSIFNAGSKYIGFSKTDRYIMNILYDPRLKVGTSKRATQKLLPKIYNDVRHRLK